MDIDVILHFVLRVRTRNMCVTYVVKQNSKETGALPKHQLSDGNVN